MRFGIIGLGNHAINRVMPAMSEAGHRITAVYSRNIDKARKEGLRYQAQAFDDLEALLEFDKIDALYIASPNFLHYSQAKAALESGRHVLLEKQMTLEEAEAEELVEIAKANRLKLAIGFHMRFHPAIAEVRRIVQNGELGDVAYISGMWAALSARSYEHPDNKWWREDEKVGGGSVMGTGVHVMDTLNYIMGKAPERISSFRNPRGEVIEETEHVTVEYSGTIADIISSRAIKYPMNNITIYGNKGTLVATGLFSTSVETTLLKDGKRIREFHGVNMYREELKAFASLVETGKSHIATGEDGLEVVRMVHKAYLSDKEGMNLTLD